MAFYACYTKKPGERSRATWHHLRHSTGNFSHVVVLREVPYGLA